MIYLHILCHLILIFAVFSGKKHFVGNCFKWFVIFGIFRPAGYGKIKTDSVRQLVGVQIAQAVN